MKRNLYQNVIFFGLVTVMIFAPLAHGAVQLWSVSLIELAIFTLSLLWLWRANNQGKKLLRTKIDLALWLFIILAIVSSALSIYKYASIMALLRLLMYGAVFYLVVNNFDRYLALRLVALIIAVGALLSLLGLGQYFLGLRHSWWKPNHFLAATYVNHNHFAGYLQMAIPLAIALLLLPKTKITQKMALSFALLLMVLAFILAQSRAAWVALGIALMAMNLALIKSKVLKKESLVIFLLLIVLGLVYLHAGYDAPARRLQSMQQVYNQDLLGGRNRIWQGSLKMIKDKPWLGSGPGTFVWAFPPYRPKALQVRSHYAHNEYLHTAAEMGLFALPLLLWMIIAVIKSGFKQFAQYQFPQAMVLAGATGILSLSLHNLVDFNFHIPANMLLVVCLAAIILRRSAVDKDA